MNKITSYNDLLKEEEQLEALLKAQKELLAEDVSAIKDSLHPAKLAMSVVSKFGTRDHSNFILNNAANKVIDFVVKKVVLAKAGWITKLAVPFFLKNYSSHVISENKDKWLSKLFAWVSNRNGNGKHEPAQKTSAEMGDQGPDTP